MTLPVDVDLKAAGAHCGNLLAAAMPNAYAKAIGRNGSLGLSLAGTIGILEHRAEKWDPVFCNNDATTKN